MNSIGNVVATLFQSRGDSEYGGEGVSQREHALQAALLAQQAGANEALVAAALLHDIGHLLHDLPDDAPEQHIDDVHENRAAAWLTHHFGPHVTEPVRLHVAAKRYLCAVDPDYLNELSPPSVTSLRLQGGPMSVSEIAQFKTSSHYSSALRLRRWDDAAKVPSLVTPSVEEFVELLDRVAISEPPVPLAAHDKSNDELRNELP